MRKSHFNDWLLFLALENFRWSSARNEPKCIFPLKIWRFYYFIFEVVVCGAQVCVCVTPCHRLESVLMFWDEDDGFLDYKDFFWMERPEPGVLEDFVPLDRRSVRNRSLEQVVKKSCSTSDVDSWPVSPEKTRDCCEIHGVALQKMFLVWILVSYLCVCSAVVAVVVRTGLSPVLQLWKFCPNFLLKTFILFVLVHGLLRQRLIFPVKTKTFKKKNRNNNMWPYSTDLWFSSHQWFLKLGAETP